MFALYRALVRLLLEHGAQFCSQIKRVDNGHRASRKGADPSYQVGPLNSSQGYQRRLADHPRAENALGAAH